MPKTSFDIIFETAHQLGLVPLVALGVSHGVGRPRDIAYWWLAGAYAVSWLADWAAHVVDPFFVGLLYPVTQATLVMAVLRSRQEAATFALCGTATALFAAGWRGMASPDVLVRTVAWGALAAIVYRMPSLGRLRTALLVTFGGGWLAWLGYAVVPGWTSWSIYQLTRVTGVALFLRAAWRPSSLRLAAI